MKEHPIYRSQISETLAGDSAGLDGAWLAWKYAKAIREANRMLEEASSQLSSGNTLTPYIHLMGAPHIFKRAESLKLEDEGSWTECCEYFGWSKADGLKSDLIDVFESVFLKGDEARQLLLTEYHSRMSSDNALDALAIIKILASEFPKEEAYKADVLRLTKRLGAELEADLMEIAAGVVNGVTEEDTYLKYEKAGLDMTIDGNLLSGIRKSLLSTKHDSWVKRLAKTHSMSSNSAQWKACEGLYFEVRDGFENGDFSELVSDENKAKLEDVKKTLSLYRGENDLGLQLRDAENEFTNSNPTRKEKQELIKRITGLVEHGQKLGYELDYSLLERMKSGKSVSSKNSKNKAKGKSTPSASPKKPSKSSEKAKVEETTDREKKGNKMPLFIGIGGVAAAIAIGCVFISGGDDSVEVAKAKSAPVKEVVEKKPEPKKEVKKISTKKVAVVHDKGLEKISQVQAEKAAVDVNSVMRETSATIPAKEVAVKESAKTVAPVASEVITPKKAVVEKPDFVDASRLVDQMATVVRLGYSKEGLVEMERIESEIKELLADGGKLDKGTIEEIGQLKIKFGSMSGDRIQELETIANYWVSKSEDAIEELKPLVFEKEVEEGLTKAQGVVASAKSAIEKVVSLGGHFDANSFDESVRAMDAIAFNLNAYKAANEQLLKADTLADYYSALEHLQSFEMLPDSSRMAIVETLHSRVPDLELLQPLLLPRGKSGWGEIKEAGRYSEHIVKVSSEERAQLLELANDEYTGSVYMSKVSNYQGSDKPVGEYWVYLSQPIPDLSKKKEQTGNLAFVEYGFDANGKAEDVPNDLTLLVMEGGRAYGFFYEKSKLSPESAYFNSTIKKTLKTLAKGAQRKVAIEFINNINTQGELSPAFRAYWKKTVVSFMKMDSWKWGVDFSPSLQDQVKQLGGNGASVLTKYSWLTEKELGNPNKKWEACLVDGSARSAVKEMDAFVSLLQHASTGQFVPVGFGEQDGSIRYSSTDLDAGTLYKIDRSSSTAVRFEEGAPLAEFAPVFRYSIDGAEVGSTIQKTSEAASLDLATPAFKSLLPPIFAR